MEEIPMKIDEPSIQEIFPEVEIFFRDYIRSQVLLNNERIKQYNQQIREENENQAITRPLLPKLFAGVNICCSEDERNFLMDMASELKRAYPLISNKDICIAIIYSYYGLVLGEQTEDYLTSKAYNGYADNNSDVTNLFFAITTGSIPLDGKDLASAIRRHMLGLNESRGGSKKGKTKNNKRTRRRRNKRTRRTYKKKGRKLYNKK